MILCDAVRLICFYCKYGYSTMDNVQVRGKIEFDRGSLGFQNFQCSVTRSNPQWFMLSRDPRVHSSMLVWNAVREFFLHLINLVAQISQVTLWTQM